MTILSDRQIGEQHARDFLGNDTWKAWKQDFDELMAFRKSLKGKPDADQLAIIKANAQWIAFYDRVLWHSSIQGPLKCTCADCAGKRK
jgi:hypothetical protein